MPEKDPARVRTNYATFPYVSILQGISGNLFLCAVCRVFGAANGDT